MSEDNSSIEKSLIRKGGADKYDYKHFVLDNGARVILIRRDDLEKSPVAVSVGVGSREDPPDSDVVCIPGGGVSRSMR